MPESLRVDEVVAERTFTSNVVRNVSISSGLPAAARVVSVNARVEIDSIEMETGYVIVNGVIRSTIYYAPVDDESNVQSFRRNFTFSERISVRGARRGLDADAEALITDINFNLINQRNIGLEYTVAIDLDITAPDTIPFVPERDDIDIRRERFRIQRSIRERNYTRSLVETVRLPSGSQNIRRVVDVETAIQVSEITTSYDRIRVRGIIRSSMLYVNQQGQVEYVDLTYGYNESFSFSGVTPEMNAYVETRIIDDRVEMVDNRRVRLSTEIVFTILVIAEEMVEIPTEIIRPIDGLYPDRRTVIVERVVVEERTRVSARDSVTIPQGNPDIARVISASGNIRGGSIDVDADNRGVLISGEIDANIIYVADLPQQPVYFAPAVITFSNFLDFPEVRSNMRAYADIDLNSITATRVSDRELSVRAVLNINILVTERVRVPIITGIRDQPVPPVQLPTPIPTRPGETFTYIVKSGDTLYEIAQRFGITVDRIVAINNISDPENLRIGQSLLIPRS